MYTDRSNLIIINGASCDVICNVPNLVKVVLVFDPTFISMDFEIRFVNIIHSSDQIPSFFHKMLGPRGIQASRQFKRHRNET